MSYKWYGHYENGAEFVIDTPKTPRHWYNYFFNDDYVTFTSQVGLGEGFAQDSLGRRVPVLSNRGAWALDKKEKKAHSLFALPISDENKEYSCRHGIGYSEISLLRDGIRSRIRIFVPNGGMRENWSVTLKNESGKPREFSLVTYVRTECDGTYRPQCYNVQKADYAKDKNAAYGYVYLPFESDRNVPVWVYLSAGDEPLSFDTRRTTFVGAYGEEQTPDAITSFEGCRGTDCIAEKICLALEHKVSLKAGEEKTFEFSVGCAFAEKDIFVPSGKSTAAEFAAMKEKYENVLGGVTINTPWDKLNKLTEWLKYGADLGSRWARVRHNGYRDLTSDTECFATVDPALAKERIKRILTYQYENGYAPRTIIDGAIKDRNFADNTVWLTFAVDTVVKESGDLGLLDEVVPFNNGSRATVYEHIKRSVCFLRDFTGLYGLVRIWGGDWNDCINFAGLKGKGVSVWLSIAWYRAAVTFAKIARKIGNTADAEDIEKSAADMREKIDKYGWDGDRYIYARTDDDIIMGGRESEESQIFLIPQLWAVLSGVAKENKAEIACDTVEKLLETDIGTVLNFPSFSHQYDYIGSMAEKPTGCQDNGGVYLHPSAWKLASDSLMHRADRVEEGLRKILPWDETYGEKCGEPYILFNSYFSHEAGYRKGTPGQSWRSAAGSWMLKSLVEYIYGLHPEFDGLRIDPCIPPSWNECSIRKVFRGTEYNVKYIRKTSDPKAPAARITVDGKPASALLIPDGGKHDVTVTIG